MISHSRLQPLAQRYFEGSEVSVTAQLNETMMTFHPSLVDEKLLSAPMSQAVRSDEMQKETSLCSAAKAVVAVHFDLKHDSLSLTK